MSCFRAKRGSAVFHSLALAAFILLGAAAPAPAPAPGVSPAEAQSLLNILNDPVRRAAFTAALQTMVKAHAATQPKAAASLTPDSVGAEVLKEGTSWLSQLTGQVAAFTRLLGALPAVWRFTLHSASDPGARARLIDAGWRVGGVLAIAIAADFALAYALQRPIRALAARAEAPESLHPNGAEDVPQRNGTEPNGIDANDIEAGALDEPDPAPHPPPRSRRSKAWRSLRRLPWAMLRLILELLPIAAFLGLGYTGTLFADPPAQDILRFAIIGYLACRLATALTRSAVSPGLPSLRLVHLTDEGAEYAVLWIRRLVVVAAAGYMAVAIGMEFGLPAAAGQAVLKAVALIDHLFLVVIVLQCRASVAGWIRGRSEHRRFGGLVRRRLAAAWHLVAIFFILGLWLVWAGQLHHGYARLWHLFLVTAGVLVAARLLGIVLLGALDRAFRISPPLAARYPGLEARANRYYPLLRGTVSTLLVIATGIGLLQVWGVNTLLWFRASALGSKLVTAGITILIAGLVALAIWEAANASMDRQLARMTREAQMVRAARFRTLLPILRTLLFSALLAVFGLTALSEIGVNIAPLLAGAGILGVAIGFGSQKLVQDFITGIFLLIENAMQVGDWVTVAGLSGSVENLSIRTMRLRAGDGSVHIIPFSSVSTVTNVNRGIGNAAVSVSIPIEEDSDHVSDVLADIAKQMRSERRFGDMMRSDFQLWGVDKVDAGTVTIVGQIVCTDGGRWAVQREFNRRMAMRFKEAGIRIATPTSTVLMRRVAQPETQVEEGSPPPHQLTQSPPPAALGNTA